MHTCSHIVHADNVDFICDVTGDAVRADVHPWALSKARLFTGAADPCNHHRHPPGVVVQIRGLIDLRPLQQVLSFAALTKMLG